MWRIRREVRALVVTNMWPSPERPAYGAFVRDQVDALRRLPGIEVEVFAFPPKGYARAARDLRRRHGPSVAGRFDVVHAHFGLTAWVVQAVHGAPRVVTLHGTDVVHPRTGRLTRMILPRMDLVATVSAALEGQLGPRWAGRTAVLPSGVAMERFRPLPRGDARRALGLDPDEPCLLFPADPARPKKRHDRAMEVARDVRLLSLGDVDPAQVPLWVNAANAVLVPSDSEGFGLAVLEALACDVPVLATPVGNHPDALAGIAGTLCAPFDAGTWRAAVEPHLRHGDPRVAGRERAGRWGADRMARRVVDAWTALLAREGTAGGGNGRRRIPG
jgi:glycosyltransferase involved in cell wall biosynthesis